jgi:hypothetical protein
MPMNIFAHSIRRSRRRRALIAVGTIFATATALGFYSAQQALAVHDLAFQLDGDVSSSTTTNVGGHTQGVDWDSIFTSAGANKNPLPSGFTAARFVKDFNNNGSTFLTNDDTTFATGSKDTLPITPGWQCNHDANVNSKIDIMNAYSAAYTDPGTGHQILYFSLERNSNAGDGNVGFWFLQDPTAGCTSPSGSVAFSGQHLDGDLLIVSAFTNGGSVSTIDVYRWNRPGNPAGVPGSLGTTSVAHGVDCKSTGGGDSACATVNGPTNGTGGTITTPWLTANKQDGVGHSLRTSEFFEGGLDLTATNLGGHCFNTFLSDTRSSQSLTATLFDYASGQLGECTSSTVTTPKDSNGATLTTVQIPANAQISVHDSATVTVAGLSSFTGTVSFHLCFFADVNSTSTCDTGGTAVGSTSITANGTYSSSTATVTSVGKYCFRADFVETGNAGIPSSSDHSATECFKVTPRTPTLATQAGAGPVDFGNSISDTATLTGTANEPGSPVINPTSGNGPAQGTITFKAYGPDNCTTVAFTSSAVAVNGDGTYGPVSFTPAAPGTYHWVASYSGDSPNTNPTDHNTDCSDTNEDVVVRQVQPTITTAQDWLPNDSATIDAVAGGDLSGSVRFRLYSSSDCTTGLLYDSGSVPVSGAAPQTVSTSNTSTLTSSATVSWLVEYTSNNQAQKDVTSACNTENSSLTIHNG